MAWVVSTLLVTAPVHIMYSARIKPYVFEGVLVTILAAMVPAVARRQWTPRFAAAWLSAMVIIGTFSAFSLVATAVASLVLATESREDRRVRFCGLAIQGVLQVLYLRTVQSHFNSALVAENWGAVYDGYPDVRLPLSDLFGEIDLHLSRTGSLLGNVDSRFATVLVLVAMFGLALSGWGRRRDPGARLVAVLFVIAIAGSVVKQIPFGPALGNPVFPGGRAMIWLLPGICIGLALAIEQLLARAAKPKLVSGAAAAFLFLLGAAVLVSNGDIRNAYPSTGSATSVAFVRAHMAPDARLILANGTHSFAAEGGRFIAKSDPSSEIGFRLLSESGQVWDMGIDPWNQSTDAVEERIGDARVAVVYNGFVGFGDAQVPALEKALKALGFEAEYRRGAFMTQVSVWER